MQTFKNHRGQLHKTNTALVALTSLYVIDATVALSAPYWVSSTSMLAPLAAFAATPLGIGILATVAIALIGLAIYAISRNNKISELEAPKIVRSGNGGQMVLQITNEEYEHIKENNQHKDEKGTVIEGKHCICFTTSKGEACRIIIGGQVKYKDHEVPILPGSTKLFNINSLEVKNKEDKFEAVDEKEWSQILGLENAKEFNTYLGEVSVSSVNPSKQAK